MPAARSAVNADAGARKWNVLGCGVPRPVTEVSRFTAAKSAARRAAAPVSGMGWPVPETTAGMNRAVSGACGCRVSSSTPVLVL